MHPYNIPDTTPTPNPLSLKGKNIIARGSALGIVPHTFNQPRRGVMLIVHFHKVLYPNPARGDMLIVKVYFKKRQLRRSDMLIATQRINPPPTNLNPPAYFFPKCHKKRSFFFLITRYFIDMLND
jgi:hypothetical protein